MDNKKPKLRFREFTDDWKQCKYENIGVCLQGGNLSYADLDEKGKYKCVLYGELYTRYDTIIKDIINRTNKVSNEIKKNDILFPQSTTVDNWSLISPACMNDDSAYTSGVFVIRPNKDIDGNFVAYYSKGNNKQHNKLAKNAQGLTIVHLYYQSIKDESIKVPKLNEQQKISNLLITLDNLITLNQRKYDKLVNVKKSLIEKMFPKNSRNVPEVRFKGFTEIWEQCKFGDIGYVSMCKRIFKNETSEFGDIPFYKIGTFGETADAYISNEKYQYYKSKFSYPAKGDILLSASGTIGRIVEYNGEKAYFQDSNIVWLNHNNTIINKFLKVLYPTIKWDGIEGSTIKRLYNSNFLNSNFKKPSIEEQEKIGTLFSKIDSLITLHQCKIENLKKIKQTLLEKMFI